MHVNGTVLYTNDKVRIINHRVKDGVNLWRAEADGALAQTDATIMHD